jgi:hypothetical protein
MKTRSKFGAICIIINICFLGFLLASADTIVMSNHHILNGTVIQTNDDEVLVLTPYAAFNFSINSIKEIKVNPGETNEPPCTNNLPPFQKALLFLSQQSWATNLMPIPATVIDKGILRNVPYSSFRCAGDYEVNVYGDLENPSGIEIGVYRKLLNNDEAKSNCLNFICGLLNQKGKEIVQMLDLNKDLITHDGMTFEITPPSDEDAYNG